MNSRLFGAIAVLALVAACSSSSDDAGEIGLRVEQLFTGGLIVDGSGSAPFLADITILDPDRYRDQATFEQPRLYTEGVAHVLVNGTFAVRDGKTTGAMAGVAISRPME